jgi:Protein of unknown function (DUF3489)
LLSVATRAIDVVTATIAAKRRNTDMISENNATAPESTASVPKATKGSRASTRRAPVAPAKGKSGKKAAPAKKAPKGAKQAKAAKPVREASKTDRILELLKRPGGATAKELMKATNWQPHSVRGFLSGTIGKKMGLAVVSIRGEGGERAYSVEA